MSKGSPIVPVRIPEGLLAEIDAVVGRSQATRFEGGWTRSAFILQAIRDKLRHQQRGRKPRGKGKGTETAAT